MTRELKFRAWKIIREPEQDNVIEKYSKPIYIDLFDIEDYELCTLHETYLVDQYTGLKDKNGQRIYEGDIIAVETCIDDEEITFYEVYWDEDTLEYGLRTLRGINYDSCVGELSPSSVIVIGNLYENPELSGA